MELETRTEEDIFGNYESNLYPCPRCGNEFLTYVGQFCTWMCSTEECKWVEDGGIFGPTKGKVYEEVDIDHPARIPLPREPVAALFEVTVEGGYHLAAEGSETTLCGLSGWVKRKRDSSEEISVGDGIVMAPAPGFLCDGCQKGLMDHWHVAEGLRPGYKG